MTSSAEALAARLAGAPVRGLTQARPGGNNRLYRVDSDAGVFALKTYPQSAGDTRDRLGTEFAALSLLAASGFDDVPAAVAADPDAGAALYAWIDGTPVAEPGAAEVDAALDFTRRLHGLAGRPGAEAMPLASEACLSAAELAAQLTRRLDRLAGIAALTEFLDRRLKPACAHHVAAAHAGYAAQGWDFDRPVTRRTLSPSDFGFHNALRRQDGGLVFLDMEYFGWDDPVKLAADFALHPGMALSDALGQHFVSGAKSIFSADPGFAERFRLHFPLYGIRWCLIILNEFLPERWARRTYAGETGERGAVLARQLAKAETLLAALGDKMEMVNR